MMFRRLQLAATSGFARPSVSLLLRMTKPRASHPIYPNESTIMCRQLGARRYTATSAAAEPQAVAEQTSVVVETEKQEVVVGDAIPAAAAAVGLTNAATTATATATSEVASSPSRKKGWICTDCGYDNFLSNAQCWKCKAAAPQGSFRLSLRTWDCPHCQQTMSLSYSVCSNCNAARPRVSRGGTDGQATAGRPGGWMCSCGENNFKSRMTCRRCKAPSTDPDIIGGWCCSGCGGQNYKGRTSCYRCKKLSPTDAAVAEANATGAA